jgi:hypothetical protein
MAPPAWRGELAGKIVPSSTPLLDMTTSRIKQQRQGADRSRSLPDALGDDLRGELARND